MQGKEVLTTLKVAGGLGAAVVEALIIEIPRRQVFSCYERFENNGVYKVERRDPPLEANREDSLQMG